MNTRLNIDGYPLDTDLQRYRASGMRLLVLEPRPLPQRDTTEKHRLVPDAAIQNRRRKSQGFSG